MKPDPTFNLDTSWISQVPQQQALLLFFALHHYQEQVEQGNPVGAAWLQQFPQEWLAELRTTLNTHVVEATIEEDEHNG